MIHWSVLLLTGILLLAILAAALFFLMEKLLVRRYGNCKVEIGEPFALKTCEEGDGACFSFDVSFVNNGRQHSLIIDFNARLQPKGDIFRYSRVDCRVINLDNIRLDDYWEGFIIKPGKRMTVRVFLKIKDAQSVRADLEDFSVDLLMRYYGRGLMEFHRFPLSFRRRDFEPADSEALSFESLAVKPEMAEAGTARKAPEGVTAVKTHILMPGEDLVEVAERYVVPIAGKGDIFTIAESALAIIQKRVYYVDDVKPGPLAVRLSNFFNMDSSLSSPYSMQKAIDEAGAFRLCAAVFVGSLGKLIGRSGDFYRVAGKSVSVIDDCTGTLPPFDKYIVMGPDRIGEEVERVKKATQLEAAVVDANDLHKVDVLVSTDRELNGYIEASLNSNPAGNGNEQTPVVLIKAPDKK